MEDLPLLIRLVCIHEILVHNLLESFLLLVKYMKALFYFVFK
jgi:hypothetical protein